jgi:hypothetical protein
MNYVTCACCGEYEGCKDLTEFVCQSCGGFAYQEWDEMMVDIKHKLIEKSRGWGIMQI